MLFLFINSYTQNTIDDLIYHFDNFNREKVLEIINSGEIETDKLDEVQISIYNLINLSQLKLSPYVFKDNEFDIYVNSIDFFLKIGLEESMPFFINDLSKRYKLKDEFNRLSADKKNFLIKSLKRAIEIEKKGENKSRWTSNTNLFDSYQCLGSMDELENRISYRMKALEVYENNKSEFDWYEKYVLQEKSYITNLISRSDTIIDEIRSKFALDFFTQHVNERPNTGEWNEFFDFNYFQFIDHLYEQKNDGLIKEIGSIVSYDYYPFGNLYASYKLDESLDNFLRMIKEVNKNPEILRQSNSKNNYEGAKTNFNLIYFDFSTNFFEDLGNINAEEYKIYTDIINVLLELIDKGGILNQKEDIFTITNVGILSDYISSSDFNYELYKRLESKIIEKYFNEDIKQLNPSQLNKYVLNKLESYQDPMYNNEIGNIFEKIKVSLEYEDYIFFLNLFWDSVVEIGLGDYSWITNDTAQNKVEKEKLDQIKALNFLIFSELENDNSYNELRFKISLALNLEHLERIKNKIKSLKDMIVVDEMNKLTQKLLEKQYSLDQNYETASELYNYIVGSEKNLRDNILWAVELANDFEIFQDYSYLSSILLDEYAKNKDKWTNSRRFFFEFTAGIFFKKIGNTNQAYTFMYEAVQNDYLRTDTNRRTMKFTTDLYSDLSNLSIRDGNYDNAEIILNTLEKYINDLDTLNDETFYYDFSYDKDYILMERASIELLRGYSNNNENNNYQNALELLKKGNLITENNFLFERLEAFVDSKIKNIDAIEERKRLIAIYDKYAKELDPWFYTFIKKEVKIEDLVNRVNFLKNDLQDSMNLINSLSYGNQLSFFRVLNMDFSVIMNDYVKNFDNEYPLLVKEIGDLLLLIDSMDKYNSSLLSLTEEKQQKYFRLLNKQFTIAGQKNEYLKATAEFDAFQQEIKSSLSINEFNESSFNTNLKENQAYIRFFRISDENYFVFIYTKDDLIGIHLSEVNLGSVYKNYIGSIMSDREDELSYKYLFEKINNKLSTRIDEIYIKNDGVFHNINLESIMFDNKFLYEKYDFNYVQRPQSVFFKSNIDFKEAFLFGNPLFDQNNTSVSKVRSGLNQLPNTEKEIKNLNRILRNNQVSTITTNLEDSNEENFYKNLNTEILHIATHGFFNNNEKISRYDYGLLASNSKNVVYNDFKKEFRNDGVIFGQEIMVKNLTKNRLTVLSACDTGKSILTDLGNENLATSFLRAGSKNVISTLWPVDDQVTFEFMGIFYRKLVVTNNIKKSLNLAKEEIKRKYKKPRYWAPFTLIQNEIYN